MHRRGRGGVRVLRLCRLVSRLLRSYGRRHSRATRRNGKRCFHLMNVPRRYSSSKTPRNAHWIGRNGMCWSGLRPTYFSKAME